MPLSLYINDGNGEQCFQENVWFLDSEKQVRGLGSCCASRTFWVYLFGYFVMKNVKREKSLKLDVQGTMRRL